MDAATLFADTWVNDIIPQCSRLSQSMLLRVSTWLSAHVLAHIDHEMVREDYNIGLWDRPGYLDLPAPEREALKRKPRYPSRWRNPSPRLVGPADPVLVNVALPRTSFIIYDQQGRRRHDAHAALAYEITPSIVAFLGVSRVSYWLQQNVPASLAFLDRMRDGEPATSTALVNALWTVRCLPDVPAPYLFPDRLSPYPPSLNPALVWRLIAGDDTLRGTLGAYELFESADTNTAYFLAAVLSGRPYMLPLASGIVYQRTVEQHPWSAIEIFAAFRQGGAIATEVATLMASNPTRGAYYRAIIATCFSNDRPKELALLPEALGVKILVSAFCHAQLSTRRPLVLGLSWLRSKGMLTHYTIDGYLRDLWQSTGCPQPGAYCDCVSHWARRELGRD